MNLRTHLKNTVYKVASLYAHARKQLSHYFLKSKNLKYEGNSIYNSVFKWISVSRIDSYIVLVWKLTY